MVLGTASVNMLVMMGNMGKMGMLGTFLNDRYNIPKIPNVLYIPKVFIIFLAEHPTPN